MFIVLVAVIVVLALCGIYGPRHDKFVEEQKKRDEEFEAFMKESDRALEDMKEINEWMDQQLKKLQEETEENLRLAKEHGINTEKLLSELEES